MKKIVKNYILEARARAGLSQTDVRRALDVRQGTVSAWENQRSQPRPAMAIRVADLFMLPVEALYEFSPETE